MEIMARLMDGDKVKRSMKVDYEIGNNLGALVKRFGEESVYNQAVDNIVIGVQSWLRGQMKPNKEGKRKTDAEIVAALKDYKPGNRKPADPVKTKARIVSSVQRMDTKDREALIRELQASLAKGPQLVKADRQAAGDKPKKTA